MTDHLLDQILQVNINDKMKEFFQSDRRKIFYGAGKQSRICRDLLKQLGIEAEYLVTDGRGRNHSVIAYHSKILELNHVSDRDKVECDILIAVHEKHNIEIRRTLMKAGFQHIYWCDSWNTFNESLREITFENYLNERIQNFDSNSGLIEYNGFKITGLKGQPVYYTSPLIGDFFDVVAPSIFHDVSQVTEGPYEWGPVKLKEGDVVLDLGANIGLFSCVAASKNCRVHAFEPTPITIGLLKKNQILYPNHIVIVPYAVCDKVGKTEFFYNPLDETTQDIDIGMNSIHQRIEGFQQLKVNAITIDAYIEEKQIDRVDFIKADIEGAERDMLRGAGRTLKEFAPKLALCTYHLPDDKDVMEKLILEANPDYQIEHKWGKLYAYVPDQGKENQTR